MNGPVLVVHDGSGGSLLEPSPWDVWCAEYGAELRPLERARILWGSATVIR